MPNPGSAPNNSKLIVCASPHIELSGDHIVRRMWMTLICLVPAGLAGIYIFGLYALYLILTCLVTAVITEAVILKLRKKPIVISDASAAITGLLLAYNLSPRAPLWLAVVGTIFSVAIGKHAFGGLGFNIFNPALLGRAFLMASWPKYMTSWASPRWWPDTVSSATPLAKEVSVAGQRVIPSYLDLFLGNHAGCIGEVCIAALLLGAAVLLIKRYISWQIPVTYIGTVVVLSFKHDALFSVLSGGLILGAFFMATDYVTAPITKKGKIIFGIGCGLITFVIRKWGGYPEGVSYAILMMNAATPIIDRFSRTKKLGQMKTRLMERAKVSEHKSLG